MRDREKRIKYLIYLEAEKIRLAKIKIKQYKKELKELEDLGMSRKRERDENNNLWIIRAC